MSQGSVLRLTLFPKRPSNFENLKDDILQFIVKGLKTERKKRLSKLLSLLRVDDSFFLTNHESVGMPQGSVLRPTLFAERHSNCKNRVDDMINFIVKGLNREFSHLQII